MAKEAEVELIEQEREFAGKEGEFEQENRLVALDNERLHEQSERHAIERDLFEREAARLKVEAERD